VYEDDEHDEFVFRLRAELDLRGAPSAKELLDVAPFRLHHGTNDFGDDFQFLIALLPAAAYERLRRRESALARSAHGLVEALDAIDEPVRMIVIDVDNAIARWSPDGYRCLSDPIGEGGYARVYKAIHEKTGAEVAFKRPRRASDSEAVARLRREIQEQSKIEHRHVMPILDHAEDYGWFTMPLADGNLADQRSEMDEDALVEMLDEAAQGLEAAHALGLVHRDVTPRNILLLDDEDGVRWVVGDWGMVRRPRGLTSTMRTQPGDPFGTEGFVAPEVMRDAHAATPCADVYSLGRVFGFALTGDVPLPGIAQVVPDKWRLLVRTLTEPNRDRRVQTMSEVRRALRRMSAEPVRSQAAILAELEGQIDAGEPAAAVRLLDLALAAPDEDDLWLDHVAKLPRALTEHLVVERPADMVNAFDRIVHHVRGTWRDRSFDLLNVPLRWLFAAAEAARVNGDAATLEEACRALFELEDHCRRYEQRHKTRAWLEGLRTNDAETVARVLRAVPAAASWYLDERWSPQRCDRVVRDALIAAAAEQEER